MLVFPAVLFSALIVIRGQTVEKGCGQAEISSVFTCFDGQYPINQDQTIHTSCYANANCYQPIINTSSTNNVTSSNSILNKSCRKTVEEEAKKKVELCVQKTIPSFSFSMVFGVKNFNFEQEPVKYFGPLKLNGSCYFPKVRQCYRQAEYNACKIFDSCVVKSLSGCSIAYTKRMVCSCARSVFRSNQSEYIDKYLACVQKATVITKPILLAQHKSAISGHLYRQPQPYCAARHGPCGGLEQRAALVQEAAKNVTQKPISLVQANPTVNTANVVTSAALNPLVVGASQTVKVATQPTVKVAAYTLPPQPTVKVAAYTTAPRSTVKVLPAQTTVKVAAYTVAPRSTVKVLPAQTTVKVAAYTTAQLIQNMIGGSQTTKTALNPTVTLQTVKPIDPALFTMSNLLPQL